MFSSLKRLALPVSVLQVSAVTLAVTGAISATKTSPAVAQSFVCIPAGKKITSSTNQKALSAAKNSLKAFKIPGTIQTFTRESGEAYEFQGSNDKDSAKEIEVDIVDDASDKKTEEVEVLVAYSSVPSAVKSAFSKLVPGNSRTVLCIEKSIRPQPGPRVLNTSKPGAVAVYYELAYRCTKKVTYPASAPRDEIDRTCQKGEVNEAVFKSNGKLDEIKAFS